MVKYQHLFVTSSAVVMHLLIFNRRLISIGFQKYRKGRDISFFFFFWCDKTTSFGTDRIRSSKDKLHPYNIILYVLWIKKKGR